MARRECPFCGMLVSDYLTQCPFCHEALAEVLRGSRSSTGGHANIRRGLLYMILAAVIRDLAGGYSDITSLCH
jgi:hypothetical protein